MSNIKFSELLEELIKEAKKLCKLGSAPFTAERYIVAVINKLSEIGAQFRTDELQMMEAILEKVGFDSAAAKSELLLYINDDKTSFFLDDLYMKKKLQVGGGYRL